MKILNKQRIENMLMISAYAIPTIYSIVGMASRMGINMLLVILVTLFAYVSSVLLLDFLRIDDINNDMFAYDYLFLLIIYVPYLAILVVYSNRC